jgi:urease accessory protein UreE
MSTGDQDASLVVSRSTFAVSKSKGDHMTAPEQPYHVVVRDARVGRDRALSADGGAEVLLQFNSDRMFDAGERLRLSDGTEVVIVGATTATGDMELVEGDLMPVGQMTQTLLVRNV